MKRILSTTALAALLATPLAAASENEAEWAQTFRDMATEHHVHASDFIGSRVYVSEAEVSETTMNEADAEWEDIGEISDVLLSRDGKLDSILVDIGGFLGIGEKTVAVQMDRLKLVSDGDAPDEYFVVFNADRAALENAPAFEEWDGMADATDVNEVDENAELTEETAAMEAEVAETAEAAETAAREAEAEMTDGERPVEGYPAAPEMELDGYQTVIVDEIKAETLTGAAVYDARSDWIGEVSNLIVDADGKVTDAVFDVGGFLGIGEKPVKVGFDSLTLKQASESDELRVYIDVTEEQLEKMPEFED